MKKFIIENWFKLILGISALIIAFSYLWSINIENHRVGIEQRRVNIEQHREDRLSPSRKTLEEIFNQ